ncbi:MAG TPA: isochorismatase family cysteine hydrolase [Ensifer sp.]|nr:isochorismatase family cysteine hydrolase [Ensifer sp.]
MPLSVLDPRSALIVIDLQKGIVSLPTAAPIEGVLGNARRLADGFRAKKLPVILVNVTALPPGRTDAKRVLRDQPADWAELVADLGQQPTDHLVTKRTPGAFTRTGLEDYLRDEAVTQVFVVGVSTSNGVEATARQALELGLNVVTVIDAMTDLQADAHEWSVSRVFPRISETASTDEVLDHLQRRP